MKKFPVLVVLIATLLGTGCAPLISPTDSATPAPATADSIPSPSPAFTMTPAVQPRLTPVVLGPDQNQFPANVNPLTGLRVEDPAMLGLPAVLVSLSNMPVTTRPQAGTGFAPWIFELFIGTGTTRFMGVFYGDYPRRIPNAGGDCESGPAALQPENPWVGNRVWLDENQNGIQDPWEAGVAGICVNLYRDGNYKQSWSTSTDS